MPLDHRSDRFKLLLSIGENKQHLTRLVLYDMLYL